MHMIILVSVYSLYTYSDKTLELQDNRPEKVKEVTCMVACRSQLIIEIIVGQNSVHVSWPLYSVIATNGCFWNSRLFLAFLFQECSLQTCGGILYTVTQISLPYCITPCNFFAKSLQATNAHKFQSAKVSHHKILYKLHFQHVLNFI